MIPNQSTSNKLFPFGNNRVTSLPSDLVRGFSLNKIKPKQNNKISELKFLERNCERQKDEYRKETEKKKLERL
jgi:hypothetical protein